MIKDLIYKYLNNEASEQEIEEIFAWIEASKENKDTFIALKKAWALTPVTSDNKGEAFKEIQYKINQKSSTNKLSILKYAAVLVAFIAIGFYIKSTLNTANAPTTDVVLELSNGSTQNLSKNTNKAITDYNGNILGQQQANQITYKANQNHSKTMAYNTLKVPYGKTFKVVLSDSTVVHLNAGSTLKYPVEFNDPKHRKVTLTGEAFFEVSKNKNHPFIVSTNNIDVKVLGTKFNVSAYQNDSATHCELMEGSVLVSNSNQPENTMLLAPNQQAMLGSGSKTFQLNQINIGDHTAWLHGELLFKNMPFPEIIKKLERAYNVKINNSNKALESQHFTGAVYVNEPISNILNLLKIDTPFQFKINDNIIDITQPH